MAFYTATNTPEDTKGGLDVSSILSTGGDPSNDDVPSPHRKITFASPSATPSTGNKTSGRESLLNTGATQGSAGKTTGGTYDRSTLNQYMKNQLDLNSNETEYFTEQINTLLSTLDDREEKLAEVEQELVVTKEDLSHAKQELTQYMDNQLDLQNSEVQEYEDKFVTLSNALDEKDSELELKDTELTEMNQQLSELTVQHKSEMEVLKQQVEGLESELHDTKTLVVVKEEEIQSIQDSSEMIVNDLNSQMDELKDILGKKDEELESITAQKQETIDELKWRLEEVQGQVDRLQQVCNSMCLLV